MAKKAIIIAITTAQMLIGMASATHRRYPLVAFVDVNNNTTELPKIEPSFDIFSTTLIVFSSILLTAVGLGLIVYIRKHKRQELHDAYAKSAKT